jgi:hypothetical protein
MASQSAQYRVAAELRKKARQYRALALAIDDARVAKLAYEMSSACDARAKQIEQQLISHAA